jgi:hypothetical protein
MSRFHRVEGAYGAKRVLNQARRRQRVEGIASSCGYDSVSSMLHDWYVTRRISIAHIASSLWMSFQNARALLIEHNVPIRDLGKRLHNGRVVITADLVEEICRNGIQSVAWRLNVDYNTLRYHLNKWVVCRSLAEIKNDTRWLFR